MVRQLKYHEKKLLKKVDFLKWKNENNLRELQVRERVCGRVCGVWGACTREGRGREGRGAGQGARPPPPVD